MAKLIVTPKTHKNNLPAEGESYEALQARIAQLIEILNELASQMPESKLLLRARACAKLLQLAVRNG